MYIQFGAYKIRTHELDNKLSVQVTSDLGKVHLKTEDKHTPNFPNEMCFYMESPEKSPQEKGLKRYSFGDYSYIVGINYQGELCLFHSIKLSVNKKSD
ncbi:MAG: hypothetical protein Q9M36_15425 [Sulfurovum sp.]|nr:hypothetical protein [Sulfurovum sp.]